MIDLLRLGPFVAWACWIALPGTGCLGSPLQEEEGVELRYAIEAVKGDSAPVHRKLREVVERRLASLKARVSTSGDELQIRLVGNDPDRVRDCKRLLASMGRLELCPAAPQAVQEKFNQDGVVPEKYRAVENPNPIQAEEYAAWNGKKLLVAARSVVEGHAFMESEARQELGIGGPRWMTTWQLDEEGARRFDEAAKVLYERRPPGMIAILLDGKLKSAPVIRSSEFRGSGQVSGANNEQEAKDLAVVLKSGALPARIGRMKDGAFVPGEPEEERRFGPEKK